VGDLLFLLLQPVAEARQFFSAAKVRWKKQGGCGMWGERGTAQEPKPHARVNDGP
jgi:hypothetical protein